MQTDFIPLGTKKKKRAKLQFLNHSHTCTYNTDKSKWQEIHEETQLQCLSVLVMSKKTSGE